MDTRDQCYVLCVPEKSIRTDPPTTMFLTAMFLTALNHMCNCRITWSSDTSSPILVSA